MATPLPILIFCVALFQMETNAKIYSLEVNTDGFVFGDTEKVTHCGLEFVMDTYNKDETCVKVVQVLQNNPERMVDEFVVNCGNTWSEAKDMVSYGEDVYIKTDNNKAVWALFEGDDGCKRRKYTDNGEKQLTKEEDVLNKDECMKVLNGKSGPKSGPKIISMGADVEGYVKGDVEEEELAGLKIYKNSYNKDSTCIKVMHVFQYFPIRKVDEFTVTCDKEIWSYTDGMISYGGIVYIKTEWDRAEWAVFIKEDGYLQRSYTDQGTHQLLKEDRVLTKEEFDRVLLEKEPIEDKNEEDDDYNKVPGVISMSDISTTGYLPIYNVDSLGFLPRGMRVDSQDYYSENFRCVRLVKISAHGMKVEHMKITCDLDNGRELFGHFQFGHAFTFRPVSLSASYVGLYNMRDGSCIKKTYTVRHRRPRKVIISKEERIKNNECKALAEGENLINFMNIIASDKEPFDPIRSPRFDQDEGWMDRDIPFKIFTFRF